MKINKIDIPQEVKATLTALNKGGFDAYIVGGCVRDLLLNTKPKDWDVTTNATPKEIQKIFPESFYENNYGTVGVKTETKDETLKIIEITPYRIESEYSDNRHPDSVTFSSKIEDDLQRRDFTINALAFDPNKSDIIDLYNGRGDLSSGVIKAVGDPNKRFKEDSLRILRAIRFAAQLNFSIEQKTIESVMENSHLMGNVSRERVGREFEKIIMSKNPAIGLALAQKLNILSYISPKLTETVGVKQNKQAHKYDVWEHIIRTLQHAADKNLSLEVRLAALFHDTGKVQTKRLSKGQTTFYSHEVVSAKIARKALENLSFSRETITKVEKLVRYHMFFSDTDQITHSAVRRLIVKVGEENIWDLINLRMCDRIGTGRPKEEPYRLRKFESMIEEVIRDPLSVSMLKIDGNQLMKMFHIKPGPKLGHILHALLEYVLEDPTKNTKMFLVKQSEKLLKLNEEELKKIGERGKDTLKDTEEGVLHSIRSKRHVK